MVTNEGAGHKHMCDVRVMTYIYNSGYIAKQQWTQFITFFFCNIKEAADSFVHGICWWRDFLQISQYGGLFVKHCDSPSKRMYHTLAQWRWKEWKTKQPQSCLGATNPLKAKTFFFFFSAEARAALQLCLIYLNFILILQASTALEQGPCHV